MTKQFWFWVSRRLRGNDSNTNGHEEPQMELKPSRNYPDYNSVLKIAETLKGSIVKGGDGRNEYIRPLNDGAIAETLGASISTVRKMRLRMYGKVKQWRSKPLPKVGAEPKPDQIEEIHKKLDEILSILGRLL